MKHPIFNLLVATVVACLVTITHLPKHNHLDLNKAAHSPESANTLALEKKKDIRSVRAQRSDYRDIVCPVRCKARRISSFFSVERLHPLRRVLRPHEGIDCAASYGTEVFAAADGRVVFAGLRGNYGRLVVLAHGNGWTTLYGHLSGIERGIRQGSRVSEGETIGRVGASGLATGPHLHFEVRTRGKAVNPVFVKLTEPTEIQK